MIQENTQKLIKLLESVKENVQKIYDMEEKKYFIVKDMELDNLMHLNEEESIAVQKIERLDSERTALIKAMSSELGCSEDITVSDLCPLLPEHFRKDLMRVSTEIKNICTRLEICTERNDYILRSNSEILSNIIEISSGAVHDGVSEEVRKQSLQMLDQLI